MARKNEPKPDDPAQYKRFIDAARDAGAADSEAAADRAFRKVASPKDKNSREHPDQKK